MNKNYCFRTLFNINLAAVCVVVSLIAQVPASAVAQQSYFRSFVADYYLNKENDGSSSLRVVEEITAVFPDDSAEHGLTRTLPFTGIEDLSHQKTLDLTATRNGKPEDIALIQTEADYFDIRIGNANRTVSGTQVYKLEYTYRNVITESDQNFQTLYWNANGSDWSKGFSRLTARVHFGKDLNHAYTNKSWCYTGAYGSVAREKCTITKIDDGLEFTTESLRAHESLTFDIAFAPNTFKTNDNGYTLDTKLYVDNRLMTMTIVAAGLGIIISIFAIYAWYSVDSKRKYYKGLFIKPEYTPPLGFSVAEMAENYIGQTYGSKQVATLIDLAVNHKVELVKTEQSGLFGKKSNAWTIRVKSEALTRQQLIVLQILAGSNAPIRINQEIVLCSHTSNSALVKLGEEFETNIKQQLELQGLFEPTKKTLKTADSANFAPISHSAPRHLSVFILLLMVIWVIGWIVAALIALDESTLPSYVVLPHAEIMIPLLILITLGVAIFLLVVQINVSRYEKRTLKGLEYSRYLDGLKEYMKMAETERLQMLQSVKGADTTHAGIVKLYEKLLPYALIFNLEKSWLDELSRYYEMDDVATPTWYIGVGAFSAQDFTSAIAQVSSSASSAIVSSSSSSSSSSGGGGGFAGGGGGGGGGGTW